ncbi:heterogeneous nuclear ribonucleoprotein 1-like [Argentina anserina]|uniref:heterogeneous nuclear ribonucleoprotein 1-like n=1 Tax=Argentina anserina TaxID=57926 RepID=UPI0021769322|nr:heterogeneous nuclear ribonucleoprotein 1-like [Potentilla anserina]
MDSDQAKLFVGGLSLDTTEATLQDHFGQYGVVLGSTVTRDRGTNTPRGFGFVWFSDPFSADKALADSHVILGRKVDVKKAKPRRGWGYNRNQEPLSPQQSQSISFETGNNMFRTRKIFVGGLSQNVTELEFRRYFEKFGRVTDVVVMMDGATQRPRGFGFITFGSEESVENVMQKSFHELGGKFVEVKRAVPREESYRDNDRGYQSGGSRTRYTGGTNTYGVLPTPAPNTGMVGGFTGGTGVYGGWYPAGGFTGISYGIAPIVPQAWMFPYGNAFYPPAYMSGGGWVVAAGGHDLYNRVSEPAHQRAFITEHAPADVKSSRVEGEKLNVDGAA